MNKFYPKKHEYLIHYLGLQESLFEKLFICKKWPLSIIRHITEKIHG